MIRDLIPSMFHRRLALLGVLLTAGLALPALQLSRLTLVRGGELRREAEAKLRVERPLMASRGKILDRRGRVLAVDRPSYDLAIDYPVLTGQWAFTQAARRARQSVGSGWTELNPVQREELIQTFQPEFQAVIEESTRTFCRLTGLTAEQFQERRDKIIAEVARAASNVHERERLKRAESMARGREMAAEDIPLADVSRPIREQTTAHIIMRGVDDQIGFKLLPLADPGSGAAGAGVNFLPGLRVFDASGRDYPHERMEVLIDKSTFPGPLKAEQPVKVLLTGVATHVLGWMRQSYSAEDVASRQIRLGDKSDDDDRGSYQPGDRAGAAGLERSAEFVLRGARGRLIEQLETGAQSRVDSAGGRDVSVTVDIQLQARIQALLSPELGLTVVQPWHNNHSVAVNTPLPAAAVVIEVATGDVVALVSMPSFTRADLSERPEEVFNDPISSAFINRAIEKPYPPGSIVKPLIVNAAVAAGVADVNQRIACQGHLYPDRPDQFQCWVKKQFQTTHNALLGGDLSAGDALMVSCNIYFYQLGRALGPEKIIDWYGQFGVGRRSGVIHPHLGIGRQFDGQAGDERGAGKTTLAEATLMGIGQGPVSWTPLHAADSFATLARGGVRLLPRVRRDAPAAREDLRLDQAAVAAALEGLRRAVSDERGSGHHVTVPDALGNQVRELTFNASRVTVWGKSGTADAPAILSKPQEGERRNVLRDGDHSWFVGLVAPTGEPPRYAIAVVVDYGGSGGRVAGPIANQIIHALIAEGYL